ncbi:hypothetical protein ABEB36_013538 [Hypothenemus hampei]|uniref:Uncharacterized protein n=1 Tax=Hypothenemus hampei TaxID=57062 RepID=A0ABD1E7A5_HYPHA
MDKWLIKKKNETKELEALPSTSTRKEIESQAVSLKLIDLENTESIEIVHQLESDDSDSSDHLLPPSKKMKNLDGDQN